MLFQLSTQLDINPKMSWSPTAPVWDEGALPSAAQSQAFFLNSPAHIVYVLLKKQMMSGNLASLFSLAGCWEWAGWWWGQGMGA